MENIIYDKGDIILEELIILLKVGDIKLDRLKIEKDKLIVTPNVNTNTTALTAIVNGYVKNAKRHLLRSLCVDSVKNKDLTAINYKTELASGVRLDAEVSLTNDGLIKETIYFYEKDSTKKSVIKVTETYEYHSSDMAFNPTERGMYSQEKKWQYYFEDGTLDVAVENTKTKFKIYKTNRQILEVGHSRRSNVVARASTTMGSILVILGVFIDDATSTGKKKAYDALRSLSRKFSTDFTEYKTYGTTDLYSSIANDTEFTWLNTHVPTKAQLEASGKTAAEGATYQGYVDALELNDMQDKSVRTYFVEKLKGNLK